MPETNRKSCRPEDLLNIQERIETPPPSDQVHKSDHQGPPKETIKNRVLLQENERIISRTATTDHVNMMNLSELTDIRPARAAGIKARSEHRTNQSTTTVLTTETPVADKGKKLSLTKLTIRQAKAAIKAQAVLEKKRIREAKEVQMDQVEEAVVDLTIPTDVRQTREAIETRVLQGKARTSSTTEITSTDQSVKGLDLDQITDIRHAKEIIKARAVKAQERTAAAATRENSTDNGRWSNLNEITDIVQAKAAIKARTLQETERITRETPTPDEQVTMPDLNEITDILQAKAAIKRRALQTKGPWCGDDASENSTAAIKKQDGQNTTSASTSTEPSLPHRAKAVHVPGPQFRPEIIEPLRFLPETIEPQLDQETQRWSDRENNTRSNDDHVPIALPVDETAHEPFMADVVDEEAQKDESTVWQRRRVGMAVIVFLAIFVIVVGGFCGSGKCTPHQDDSSSQNIPNGECILLVEPDFNILTATYRQISPLSNQVVSNCKPVKNITCPIDSYQPCLEPPYRVHMLFHGGGCNQSSNTTDTIELMCQDGPLGGPSDTYGTKAFITVSDQRIEDLVYFEDDISVGDSFTISNQGDVVGPDLLIKVYSSRNTVDPEALQQIMYYYNICTKEEELASLLGSVQVVGFNFGSQTIPLDDTTVALEFDLYVHTKESNPLTPGSIMVDEVSWTSNFADPMVKTKVNAAIEGTETKIYLFNHPMVWSSNWTNDHFYLRADVRGTGPNRQACSGIGTLNFTVDYV